MPSLQVVDLGPDPRSEAVGGFARNFAENFKRLQAQKRNEQMFNKLREKYGDDIDPELLSRDLIGAEGFDPEYKQDYFGRLKDYSNIKENKEKISLRDKEIQNAEKRNIIDEIKAKNEQTKANNQAKRDKDTQVYKNQKYVQNELKARESDNIPGWLKSKITPLVNEGVNKGMTVDAAYNRVIQEVDRIIDIIENGTVTPDTHYTRTDPQELEQAAQDLAQLYQNGITRQEDLKKILKRSG